MVETKVEASKPNDAESPNIQKTAETSANDMIEKANEAAARLEAAAARAEEILARQILSGRASAGQEPPKPETPEEKWRREAKIRYKGTGMDPT